MIQRIAGALGTALFAVILQQSIVNNLPRFKGNIQGLTALAGGPGGYLSAKIAHAFVTPFWVAVCLIAVGLVPALLLPAHNAQKNKSSDALN